MWPFRAGKLLNSFKHTEHVSLLFPSALSGSVSLFKPLLLVDIFLAWNRRRDISSARSFHCRGSFYFVKEVNKVLQLYLYEATGKQWLSVLEYMGDNLDQLLPRYREGKFWVQHARVKTWLLAWTNPRTEENYCDRPSYSKHLDVMSLNRTDNNVGRHLNPVRVRS